MQRYVAEGLLSFSLKPKQCMRIMIQHAPIDYVLQ